MRFVRGHAVRRGGGARREVAVEEAEVGARPDVHERYEIDAVPIALVVDRAGTVRASFAGSVTTEELREALALVE